MTIEYRNTESWAIEARMNDLTCTRDEAIVIAQKYLKQFPSLTACVLTDETESVVSVATEWQKRN